MNKKTNKKPSRKKEQNIREQLIDMIDEDTLFADGFDEAIIGVSYDCRIIYDIDQMIKIMMKDNMDYTEAIEYLEFNTFCAYMGPMTPIYMYPNENISIKRKK